MTERYGSTRKHKKHKASHKAAAAAVAENSLNQSSSADNNQEILPPPPPPLPPSSATTSNGTSAEQQLNSGTVTPTRQQPIRMVLKLAQSGAYSPANATVHQPTITVTTDGSGPSVEGNGQPPQLLPLNSSDYGTAEFYSNGSLKRSKKKKKKHHHHHHHHHSSSRHGSNTTTSDPAAAASSLALGLTTSAANSSSLHAAAFFDSNSNLSEGFSGSANPNATLNTLARGVDDLDDEDDDPVGTEADLDDLGNGHLKAPNKNILNLIDSELMLDSSPHDSIASVDLMDVDSSNLDISCLQATGDSPADDEHNNYSSTGGPGGGLGSGRQTSSSRKGGKGRDLRNRLTATATTTTVKANASLYRRLLQRGEVHCDSTNVLAMCRSAGGRPTTKKAKAFAKFSTEVLKRLREKDVHRFFAWPVTNLMAPGYSLVVSHPMDFNTIEKKIQFGLYRSIYEMKFDVRILCENALKYYRSSGTQYKEAARLWSFAKREVFTRETFASILPQCPPLSMEDLGLERLIGEAAPTPVKPLVNGFSGFSELLNGGGCSNKVSSSSSKTVVKVEEEEDEDEDAKEDLWTKEEILREAAKCLGKEELDELASKWALTPLPSGLPAELPRRRPDGTTSLPFAIPLTTVEPDSPATLGALIGRLQEGSRSLAVPKEPEFNRVKVMQMIPEASEIPYCSHLPVFDDGPGGGSGMLNLEETGLLLSHFGHCEERYKEAILRVSEDADYMIGFVDSVLDIVTGGKYSKEKAAKAAAEEQQDDDDEPMEVTPPPPPEKDVDLVQEIIRPTKSTEAKEEDAAPKKKEPNEAKSALDGAPEDAPTDTTPAAEDSSADPAAAKPKPPSTSLSTAESLQCQLDETQSLLAQLETLQHRRLASGPEPKVPDAAEAALAEKVTSKLVALIGTVARPGDVISVDAVRKAMGVLIQDDDDDDQALEHLEEGITTTTTTTTAAAAAAAAATVVDDSEVVPLPTSSSASLASTNGSPGLLVVEED